MSTDMTDPETGQRELGLCSASLDKVYGGMGLFIYLNIYLINRLHVFPRMTQNGVRSAPCSWRNARGHGRVVYRAGC